jgi:hypothetical protein
VHAVVFTWREECESLCALDDKVEVFVRVYQKEYVKKWRYAQLRKYDG